jgi:hypothetical protein
MDPDAMDSGGTTPLMYAAAYGLLGSAIILVQYTTRLALRDQLNNRCFVQYAIQLRYINLIKGLVEWFRGEGKAEIALCILNRSIHCYLVHPVEYHPDHLQSSSRFDVAMLETLFDLGGDPDILYGFNTTAMHIVDSTEYAKVLLKHGFTAADVQDRDGQIALMRIVRFLDPKLTKAMLDLLSATDVSIDQRDSFQWSAMLHLVSHMRYSSESWDTTDVRFRRKTDAVRCMNLFLSRGAEVLLTDSCNCSCSPGGCSAIIVALHEAFLAIPPSSHRGLLETLPIDLAIGTATLTSGGDQLRQLTDAVAAFCDFTQSGKKSHECCAITTVRHWYYVSNFIVRATPNRLAAVAYLEPRTITAGPVENQKTRLINELARFYTLLERRSHARHGDELSARIKAVLVYGPERERSKGGKHEPSGSWGDCSSPVSSLQRLDLQDYRAWLSHCVEQRLQMHARGSTKAWAESALEFVDGLEREMERLRNGAS